MRITKNTVAALSGALAVLLMAGPASAQICSGYPTARGQTSIGARASFPDAATQVGIEASRNWHNPMGAFVNLNLLMPDDADADNIPVIGAGIAYEVTDMLPIVPSWLSVCPVAAVTIEAGDATGFSFPLGIGFGTSLPVTESFAIEPFIIPQFVLTRISTDDVSWDHDFGFGGGAHAKFGGVYAGVTLGRIMATGHDLTISFQGGITIPARAPGFVSR
jgi:hypothetical protein